MVALGVGMMALLTLTLIRRSAPGVAGGAPDAPNRFIVNRPIRSLLGAFFADLGMAQPVLYPMGRRPRRSTGEACRLRTGTDERAKRLVDREFNISWSQADNRLIAGSWWGSRRVAADQFSMESGIAQTLGVRLGHAAVRFCRGSAVAGTVTSLRKVDWDSFKFVVAPPALLDKQPASYVTSSPCSRTGGGVDALRRAIPEPSGDPRGADHGEAWTRSRARCSSFFCSPSWQDSRCSSCVLAIAA